jgi:beta-lactamase class A
MELASTRINRGKRRRRFFWLVLFIFLSIFLFNRHKKANTVISPLPDSHVIQAPQQQQQSANPLKLFGKKRSVDDLTAKIHTTIGDEWQNYSVVVDDFTSDFKIHISESEIFTAASVNKIPILAALYYYAQKGDIDLDEVITMQAQDVQDYGTGSMRYDKPGSTYSIKTLAKLMIKQSDNTAAYILANHIIGFDRLTAIVTEWGMSQTDMVDNKTSNQDINNVMRRMYEEKVTNHAYTQEMFSFLNDTDFESRLPAKLPENATTYHKIGTEVGVIHDAGIVTNGKQTYYIGIFTSDAIDDPSTDEMMAKVSRLVYDYMQ